MPVSVHACSCGQSLLEERYERSENVFTAFVTGGEYDGGQAGIRSEATTYFKVTETFKGKIPFDRFTSDVDTAACGISLQVGVEYLFFTPDTGRIGSCMGIAAVSGLSEQGQGFVTKNVAALRAFKTGENASLAEPWYFFDTQGQCRLSGSFPYGGPHRAGHINVIYRHTEPVGTASNSDWPHLQPGFIEMSIWVPTRDDMIDYPLALSVNDESYTATWVKDGHAGASYVVDSADVIRLTGALVAAKALQIQSAHPVHGDIDTRASLENAGDSVSRMLECISTHQSETDLP